MPSIESIMLGHEVVRWLSNVRSNLRSNAAAYKRHAADTKTDLAKLAALMSADGAELLKTIAAVEMVLADADGRKHVDDFLGTFSLASSDVDATIAELRAAAAALRDSQKEDAAKIETASDAVLSDVAEFMLPKRA